MVEFVYEPVQPDWSGQVAELAIEKFGLQDAGLSFLDHTNNVIFRVDADSVDGSGGREAYVLRINKQWATLASLERENLLLRSICDETDLVVPEPVYGTDGEYFHRVSSPDLPESRYCSLFRWVEGEFLNEELTPKHIYRVGSFTSKLHAHTQTFEWPETLALPRSDVDSKARSLFSTIGEARFSRLEMGVFRSTMGIIREVSNTLDRSDHATGVIHGDFMQWNYLFHDGEVRAIDFEECRVDYYLYELAVILSCLERQYPFPSPDREDYPELREALIEGYTSNRPLPDHFEEAIDAFVALRNLVMVDWILGWPDPPPTHLDWGQDYIDGALERLGVFVNR